MCDYCGCRSHPQIATLSREHDVLLALLADLSTAVDAGEQDRAAPLLARIHGLLHDHADREERGVFAELRRADVADRYVSAFEHDHRAIHGLLEQADAPGWQEPARALVHLLRDHIAREESDLFTAAHQLLDPRQWDAIDAVTSAGGTP